MPQEALTISVLYGTGVLRPGIPELLTGLPLLQVLGSSVDPQDFLNQQKSLHPDLVLVDLDGDHYPPEWLEHLTQEMPQTPVLVCSYNREPDFLIRAMQLGVREFLPLPLNRDDLEAAVERVVVVKKRLQTNGGSPSQQGTVVGVTGHKGGAGATTVAINLAMALAESTSSRVALVDLSRPFPDVGNFLDQDPSYTISDLMQNASDLDQSFLARIMQNYQGKLSILHGSPDFKEQDNIDLEVLERVFVILRDSFKWVIVDLGHWLDDLFLHGVRESDTLLMLTELTIPDLRNLKRFWPLLQEFYRVRERVRVVVNRYGKGSGGLQLSDLEAVVQQAPYDTLPSDYQALIEAVNQGVPLASGAPRSKIWRSLQKLAQRLKDDMRSGEEEAVAAAPGRKFWIFGRG